MGLVDGERRHHPFGSSGMAPARATTSSSATSWPGLTEALAGLNPDPEFPGFKHTIFKPQVVDGAGLGQGQPRFDVWLHPMRLGRQERTLHLPSQHSPQHHRHRLSSRKRRRHHRGKRPSRHWRRRRHWRHRIPKEWPLLDIGSGSYFFSEAWPLKSRGGARRLGCAAKPP